MRRQQRRYTPVDHSEPCFCHSGCQWGRAVCGDGALYQPGQVRYTPAGRTAFALWVELYRFIRAEFETDSYAEWPGDLYRARHFRCCCLGAIRRYRASVQRNRARWRTMRKHFRYCAAHLPIGSLEQIRNTRECDPGRCCGASRQHAGEAQCGCPVFGVNAVHGV